MNKIEVKKSALETCQATLKRLYRKEFWLHKLNNLIGCGGVVSFFVTFVDQAALIPLGLCAGAAIVSDRFGKKIDYEIYECITERTKLEGEIFKLTNEENVKSQKLEKSNVYSEDVIKENIESDIPTFENVSFDENENIKGKQLVKTRIPK